MRVFPFVNILEHLCVLLYLCQNVLTSKESGTALNASCVFNISQNGQIKHYDLSRLLKQRLWEAKVNNSIYAFVAICGHMEDADVDKCPDTQAAVCLAKQEHGRWKPFVSNVGQTMIVHPSNGEHEFSIDFVGGQTCEGSEQFSTTIFFICSNAEEVVYMSRANRGCLLMLYWSTTAACISNREAVSSCTLTLKNGAGSFDIRSLHRRQNYMVESPDGRKFELNFCMPGVAVLCTNSSLAICEITNNTRQVIGIAGKLEYSSESGLEVVYKTDHHSVEHGKRTEVKLICNYNATTVTPVFLGNFGNVYRFEVETWMACVQWPVQCYTYDTQGNRYDLKDLRKRVGNWKAVVETPGQEYLINVCAAINLDDSNMLEGVGAAACTTNSTKSCVSLGMLSAGPVKVTDGSLLLHYTGGSMCGSGQLRYETVISFVCARLEKGPVFISKSNCSHSFVWETPSACPKKYAVGKHCMLTEPTYNTVFNLNPMYSEKIDYVVRWENNSEFHLNMCGPLTKPCGGFKNASVCLVTVSSKIPIGWTSYEPQYTDGRVAFELHGAECKSGHKSTVHLLVLCNHDLNIGETTVEYLSTDSLCTFFFVWYTRDVCFESKVVPCMAKDDEGTTYDLSLLSLTSSNHISLYRDVPGVRLKFIINVCRSVVVGYGSVCSYDSGICMENMTRPNSHNELVNLGEVTNGPKFENGKLTLRYERGDMCRDMDGPPETSSSFVFTCDPAAVDTSPVFQKVEKCHYSFTWSTYLACPGQRQKVPDTAGSQDGNCTAVNPATNYRFDLTSLKQTIQFSSAYGKIFYRLPVCEGGSVYECGKSEGVCQLPGHGRISLGKSNSKLLYNKVLYLNYTDGDTCLNGTSQKNTLLEFFCIKERGFSGQAFISHLNDCTTIMAWRTHLACDPNVLCEVSVKGRTVSLTPLKKSYTNYMVSLQNYVFHINVCSQLAPMEDLKCFGGSAACVVTKHANNSFSELSLGTVSTKPVAVGNDVVLKYSNGSPCPNSPGLYISTVLHFICEAEGGFGLPEMGNLTDDCQYLFIWKTDVICPPKNETKPPEAILTSSVKFNCSYPIVKNNISVMVHFQHFSKFSPIRNVENKAYFWNPCLLKDVCNGAAVCQEHSKVSYGGTPNIVTNDTEDLIMIRFTGGSPCMPGKEYYSEIHLECAPDKKIGSLVLEREEKCAVFFVWQNPITCFDVQNATQPSSSGVSGTLVETSVTIGVLAGLATAILASFLYFRKVINRNRLRSRLHSFFHHQQSPSRVRYSKCSSSASLSFNHYQ